jgi:hypothetical protein
MNSNRRVSKQLFQNRLRKAFSMSRLDEVLVMVWCANALRKGQQKRIGGRFTYPEEAISAKPGSNFYIAPWVLETIVNEALFYPASRVAARRMRNTKSWDAFADLLNTIGDVENSQSLDDVRQETIVNSIARIAWRQFPWQTGFKSAERLFRAWYLYNFPEANQYFIDHYGISLERFCYTGFAATAALQDFPAIIADSSFEGVGISAKERDAFLELAASSAADLRDIVRRDRLNQLQIAYAPSQLRRKPLVLIGKGGRNEAFCPLDDLLVYRISDGIYYDLVASDDLRQIVGQRFESYVAEVTGHYLCPAYVVAAEGIYGTRSRPIATPDMRVLSEGSLIQAIVECKGRRMSFSLRTSPDPYMTNAVDYQELGKGVAQIWRYVADLRRGVTDDGMCIDPNTIGVLLTLDPWLQMSSDTVQSVLDLGREILVNRGIEVFPEDCIPISFVSMDDWEQGLRKISPEGFFKALRRHAHEDRHGYILATSIEELAKDFRFSGVPYDYYAKLPEVAPWWGKIGKSESGPQ